MIGEVLEGEVGGSHISSGSQRVAVSSACLWRGGRLATKLVALEVKTDEEWGALKEARAEEREPVEGEVESP